MSLVLPCGHPFGCLDESGLNCRWCVERDGLELVAVVALRRSRDLKVMARGFHEAGLMGHTSAVGYGVKDMCWRCLKLAAKDLS